MGKVVTNQSQDKITNNVQIMQSHYLTNEVKSCQLSTLPKAQKINLCGHSAHANCNRLAESSIPMQIKIDHYQIVSHQILIYQAVLPIGIIRKEELKVQPDGGHQRPLTVNSVDWVAAFALQSKHCFTSLKGKTKQLFSEQLFRVKQPHTHAGWYWYT